MINSISGHLKKLLFVAIICFAAIQNSSAQTKPWTAPPAAQAVKNPDNTVPGGKALYVSYCTPCHGQSGKGDGPAAAALTPKPADHTSAALKSESDGSLFWKISEGRKPMPQYKLAFTPAQRWQLVNYIRSLSSKGPKKS